MPEILHRASIYVSTSPTDGLSISLLEAMACGLFPIVTDVPGNRPLIQNGENGLLFPVGDSRSLAEKICLVCKDLSPSNPYSLEINRRLIEEKWSQKRAMDRMETIYSSLLRL
jgi:glycosyltransferase involved in cell wall biosynthesis